VKLNLLRVMGKKQKKLIFTSLAQSVGIAKETILDNNNFMIVNNDNIIITMDMKIMKVNNNKYPLDKLIEMYQRQQHIAQKEGEEAWKHAKKSADARVRAQVLRAKIMKMKANKNYNEQQEDAVLANNSVIQRLERENAEKRATKKRKLDDMIAPTSTVTVTELSDSEDDDDMVKVGHSGLSSTSSSIGKMNINSNKGISRSVLGVLCQTCLIRAL